MSKTKTSYRLEYWDQKGSKFVRYFSTKKLANKYITKLGKQCSKSSIIEIQGIKE